MTIEESVARIQERMENACARSGRDKDAVRLCAVSKFHTKEAVLSAYQCGVRLFGESRVQEASQKFADFRENREKYPDMEIHLIGSLQRNKAKSACALFDCVQSIDRETLIDELGVLTKERSEPLPILLEMRTAEDSKAGFLDQDALCRATEKALSHPGLALFGLMTMAPFTPDEKSVREAFRTLVSAKTFLETHFPGHWNCLSMGMSNDFEIAIEEGSTLIRVGTAIFGERG